MKAQLTQQAIQSDVQEQEHDSDFDPNASKLQGEKTLFVTERPTGFVRDVIMVEYQKLNGSPFRGTITFSEAKTKIGLEASLRYSVKMSINECPMIRFKMPKQINAENLSKVESFKFERPHSTRTQHNPGVIDFNIPAIRPQMAAPVLPRPQ